MTVYRGGAFPDGQRDVYVAEPAANVVVRLKLDASGLAASTEHVLYPDQQWGEREAAAWWNKNHPASDPDSANFDTGTLTVSITSGGDAADG